jgi:4-diphosphocytidyl-2-C-methyl-D-erythritol kinase
MIIFPNAKINIGLRIIRKRADGYHDLETFFLPIGLYDALEAMPDPSLSDTMLTESGLKVEGDLDHHLCYRAWQFLKEEVPGMPAVRMHLHKTIPMGAGLGGGSADGAFTLVLLNQLFRLGLPDKRLSELALQLGSDCPFFIVNKPCLARGRGELMATVNLELSNFELLVIHPGMHTSTRQAFVGITPAEAGEPLESLIGLPVEQWRGRIVNDFERSICATEPRIAALLEMMYAHGAAYASLTGSGSAVYGFFRKGQVPEIPIETGWRAFRPAILG